MKRDLFIDCDGVIFDTITYAFDEMKKFGIDIKNQDLITKYFKEVNWHDLIKNSGTINDSINKINYLKNCDIFNLVCVLTHRCSWDEGVVKDENFSHLTPKVKVITVPKKIAKQHAVNARGNILIDDDIKKINDWVLDGGIGVLFQKEIDTLIEPYILNNKQGYFITNDLLDLIEINKILDNSKRLIR